MSGSESESEREGDESRHSLKDDDESTQDRKIQRRKPMEPFQIMTPLHNVIEHKDTESDDDGRV